MHSHFGQVQKHGLNYHFKLVLAIGLGLCGISCFALLILINTFEAHKENSPVVIETQAKLETAPALIPVQSISEGDMLEASMFRVEMRPKAGLSENTISDYEQIHNQYAKTLILPDQPLNSAYITRERPTNEITRVIPDGYRAVTIRVDERSSVEGWARAGAMVDVSWSSTMRGKPSITLIVQNAKVISAARKIESENQNQMEGDFPTELTLLVTIEDSNKILLAQMSGSLSLALRGDKETSKTNNKSTITTDDLIDSGINGIQDKPKENIIRIKDNDGQYEEFVMRNGRLVPFFQDLTTGANSAASYGG